MTFQEYWETKGSRIQVQSHEDRARLAWEACDRYWIDWQKRALVGVLEYERARYPEHPNKLLCGMSYK